MNPKFKTVIILGIIFIIALFYRIYQLGNIPYGLHSDEVANTYGTKFILLNGHDIYGNPWPILYLDKFGDYPPVLPMYLSGIGALLFGNNEFGSRILIAIMGALIIIPGYLIALKIFKNKNTAYFTSFLFSVAPGHIVLSRLNAEGIVALTVFMYGLSFLITSLQNNKLPVKLISIAILLSTYFIYPSFRIIVPLTLIPLFVFFGSKNNKKVTLLHFSFVIVAFLLMFWISIQPWGKGRLMQTSIFSPVSGVQLKLQSLIFNEDNITIARIFNNKIIGYGKELIFQYSRYFSYNYLFGEDGIPKIYSIPYVGLLYMTLIPFILISFFGYFQNFNRKIDNKLFLYILWILAISPIPAAFTVLDAPSIQRALLTPALLIFLAAYGFNALIQFKYKKIPVIYLFIFLLLGELVFFTHNYFTHFSYYTTTIRNTGNKDAMEYVLLNRKKYDAVYITNQELWLPTYYLYYSDDYRKSLTGKFGQNFRIAKVDNVYFPDIVCPAIDMLNESIKQQKLTVPKKSLFVHTISCPVMDNPLGKKMFRHLKTIKRLDSTEVFYIVDISPQFNEKELKNTDKSI